MCQRLDQEYLCIDCLMDDSQLNHYSSPVQCYTKHYTSNTAEYMTTDKFLESDGSRVSMDDKTAIQAEDL